VLQVREVTPLSFSARVDTDPHGTALTGLALTITIEAGRIIAMEDNELWEQALGSPAPSVSPSARSQLFRAAPRTLGDLLSGEIMELTAENIRDLCDRGPKQGLQFIEPLKRIRTRHHAIARLLAAGLTQKEAAQACHVSTTSIRLLNASPAFQALVQEYLDKTYKDQVEELQQRTVATAFEYLHRLYQKSQDDEYMEMVSLGKLSDATMKLLDRAGVGPTSRREELHTHAGIPPDELESIKRQAQWSAKEVALSSDQWTEVGEVRDVESEGEGHDLSAEGRDSVSAEGGEDNAADGASSDM